MSRLKLFILTLFSVFWFSAAASADTIKIVAFGDSLTAGYGLNQSDSYPTRLEAALREDGKTVTIANAGVSGDTASAAARRLDWSIPDDTDGVIVALGGNDILRGISPELTRKALTKIIENLGERDIPVLLAGMKAPVNLGDEFVAAFEAIYDDLAKRDHVILMPFFLDGVAGESALNLPDGIHPNAEGVAVVVDNIKPYTLELLERIAKSD